jgi:REP element-mobilizing transposase RayT
VFSTKGRRELITPDVKDRLHKYMCGTARKKNGLVLTINGTKDHVHMLARIKANIAVADFIGAVKANSSKWIKDTVRGFGLFQWQEGYASFTVSESNWERVAAYIARQEAHHRRVPYAGELARLLERHRIAFDRKAYLD